MMKSSFARAVQTSDTLQAQAAPGRRLWTSAGAMVVALGIAGFAAAPAMAASWTVVPYEHNDATALGSSGPDSNSVGYPSASDPYGRLTTKDYVPLGSAQATQSQWQVVNPT